MDEYKKRKGDWSAYEQGFLELMAERKIEHALSPAEFEVSTGLLCSEATPDNCHRRLVCDYLAGHWVDVRPAHL